MRGVKESRAAQSFVFKGCRTTKGYLVDVRHPSVSRSGELPFSVGSPVHVPQEGTTRDTHKSASGWSRDVEDGTQEAGCVLQVPHPSVGLLQGTPLPLYTLDLRPISPSDAKHELSCIRCGFGDDTAGGQDVGETPQLPVHPAFLQTRLMGGSELNLPLVCFFCFNAVAV